MEARRSLKAARAEHYVEALVASAPPLTDEQRERIAAIIAPGVVMVSD